MKSNLEEMLYTVTEVSKILKCNKSFVYKLRDAGLLRFMKLGQYKVRKSSLIKFLEDIDGKDVTDPHKIVELIECKIQEVADPIELYRKWFCTLPAIDKVKEIQVLLNQ